MIGSQIVFDLAPRLAYAERDIAPAGVDRLRDAPSALL